MEACSDTFLYALTSFSMRSLYIFSKILIKWDKFCGDKVKASQPKGCRMSYVSKQGSRYFGKFESWTVIHEARHHATGYKQNFRKKSEKEYLWDMTFYTCAIPIANRVYVCYYSEILTVDITIPNPHLRRYTLSIAFKTYLMNICNDH